MAMNPLKNVLNLLPLLFLLNPTPINSMGGYSQEQLEVYDLYDELRSTTFYKFLSPDLTPTSTKKQIKSAYKKKALAWHPDKVEEGSEAANGLSKSQIEHRFRQVSQVKDILTNEELKKTYDDVLKNGLPPGMSFRYYRYIMKMSVKQVLIFCFLVLWLVHYLCLWGKYLEKKMILADQASRAGKKKAKKLETLVINKPNFWDTLPYLIFQLIIYIFTKLPTEIKNAKIEKENARLLELERIEQEKKDLEEDKKLKEEREKQKKINQQKHQEWVKEQQELAAERYKIALENAEKAQAEDDDEYAALDGEWDENSEDDFPKKRKGKGKKKGKNITNEPTKEPLKTSEWTDEERKLMLELMNKWPGGTPNRWGRIGEVLNRSEGDVTKQLKNIKQSSISTMKRAGFLICKICVLCLQRHVCEFFFSSIRRYTHTRITNFKFFRIQRASWLTLS